MALRSDARANRAALLAGAARLFAEHGADVALDAIARDAGVSIATLYRHFPRREDLIGEAYRREIEHLGEVEPLLTAGSGAEALAAWLARFVEYTRTKRAVADLVHAMPQDAQPPPAREIILAALGRLLAAGAADGTLRRDRDAEDVLALLAGFWLLPDGPQWARRAGTLSDFVVEGMRVTR